MTTYDEIQSELIDLGYVTTRVMKNDKTIRLEVYVSPIQIGDKIQELRKQLGDYCFVQKWDQDSIFVGLKGGSMDFAEIS